VGDVERAVTREVLLADNTERRLQMEGLARAFTLDGWVAEAGQAFFNDTAPGARQGIADARAAIAKRLTTPYRAAR
jgi:hypothetical protein